MKKPTHSGSGQIRIIGGQWRGRKLPVPDSPGLRPTTDRVRETLFNWLAPVMVDAHCLDCFAGSGALGLEALSRYAAQQRYWKWIAPYRSSCKKSGDAESQQCSRRQYQYSDLPQPAGDAASRRLCRPAVS